MDDRAKRSEIRRDLDNCSAILTLDQPAAKLVSFDIGTAKAIDRLLRIADEEKRSSAQPRGLPMRWAFGDSSNREQNLTVKAVGVLELVDQNIPIAPPNCLSHVFV